MADVIIRVGGADDVPVSLGDKTFIKGDKGDKGDSGADPYTDPPEDLGATPSAGSVNQYSRGDHVHQMPSAGDVGAQAVITANGILKGDGLGGVSAATAGTDYQEPLTAGVDYQTPLIAGTDYQTPLVAGTDYATPNDITSLSDRITVLENTVRKYYAKIKLAYTKATTRTRITLPFDTIAGVYNVTTVCAVSEGSAVPLAVSDNTISGTIAANGSAYIKIPSGDPSSSAGKQIIFIVYPGTANSGEYTITLERTNVTDDVTNIDIDFS